MLAVRVVVFVGFLDLFMQFPVVAPYAKSLGSSGALAGFAVAAYSAANLVGNPLAGMAVDRWGRRAPVMLGLIGTSGSLLTYALARSPVHLLVSRLAHGISASVLAPGTFAMIGDRAAPERRSRAMGIGGAIIAAAGMTGPPVAGILRDAASFEAVFVVDAALVFAALLVFWYGTRPAGSPGPAPESARPRRLPLSWGLITRGALRTGYAALLATTVGVGTLVTHLPAVFGEESHSGARTGSAFAVYALVSMIVMARPASRVSERYGLLRAIGIGLALAAVGLLVLGRFGADLGTMAGIGVFGLGFGLVFPTSAALIAKATAPGERGTAFGVFYAVYSVGVVIGSAQSGVVSDVSSRALGAPFLVAALFAIATLLAIMMLGRVEQTADQIPTDQSPRLEGLGGDDR